MDDDPVVALDLGVGLPGTDVQFVVVPVVVATASGSIGGVSVSGSIP